MKLPHSKIRSPQLLPSLFMTFVTSRFEHSSWPTTKLVFENCKNQKPQWGDKELLFWWFILPSVLISSTSQASLHSVCSLCSYSIHFMQCFSMDKNILKETFVLDSSFKFWAFSPPQIIYSFFFYSFTLRHFTCNEFHFCLQRPEYPQPNKTLTPY